ncbi:MAG: outer membrane protein assembly factor BamE [Alphaproteobacteria bacterium]|jgi:outer membrane protein assembly factor BamE (lipoprotein component of BamABCDE complex)|nr:outer membrane protein assembly factor BamE [Alphaproteobacteria bacterium]|tara:strand:- start:1141 stop:1674 length:534 start_codon:yes stop_codon:yes gene_type:complete
MTLPAMACSPTMNKPFIHHPERRKDRFRARLGLTPLALAAALTMAALAGCSPMQSSHGYVPDAELVEKLRPGVHDRDSVTSLFGSPTSVANFNGEIWLYVKQESEHIAFFDETLTDQTVLAIKFDKAGVVSGIKHYALADGKTVDLVQRKTLTKGKELTVIGQLFGNVGRFSNAGNE